MRRCAVTLAILGTVGVPFAAHATAAEVAVAASTFPSRTVVATNVLDMTQAAHEAPTTRRLDSVRAVSISARPSHARFGREFVRAANELSAERTVKSQTLVKDIRAASSSQAQAGFSFVSFGKELPDPDKAQAVEIRAITRAGAPADRLLVAQNAGASDSSTEELRDVLEEVRSPQGRSGTITVDIGKPTSAASSTAPSIRTTPDSDAGITIVGRPGQRVIEITDADFRDIDGSAPVLNRMNTDALAQQQAARDELEARNEELRAEREAQEQQPPEAEAETVAEAGEPAPVPPGPREVETVRRYDWRKGIYVRVPVDEPPVPRPSIATGPANLVEREQQAQGGTVLQGRVPRLAPEPEPPSQAETNPAEATD